jgi:glycosyltransferase involved in cell wall biosynthesis
MARGKPSVVTRIGGLSEVLEHGKQGLMVQPADHRSLAAAILTLLRKPHLRERFGTAARERAAVFDIRNAVRRTEEIYEEVLK